MAALQSSATASRGALHRLCRELENIEKSNNPQILVRPSGSNLLEWHFILHSLPADSPYHGGCYHGRLAFPSEYPHAPPSVSMITPSGRLETGCFICLSMTNFHPEHWNPAWSIETILVGLLSFFLSDSETGFGTLNESWANRRAFAASSWDKNASNVEFKELFPEFATQRVREPLIVGAPSSDVVPQLTSHLATSQPLETSTLVLRTVDECWICREVTEEPLVQPCSCRGSMSGVHASCVESWIRHHRLSGGSNGRRPRCSVCHTVYHGRDERPGLGVLLQHMVREGLRQLSRTLALVILLMSFREAAQTSETFLPSPLRIASVVLFTCVAAHKFVVLATSLPPHRLPPRSHRARRFFISDVQQLAKHVSEGFVMIAMLCFWYTNGDLPLSTFLPFACAAFLLMARLCAQSPSVACLLRIARAAVRCVCVPLMVGRHFVRLLMQDPLRIVRPLEAGPHIIMIVLAAALCLTQSNVPLVVIWSVHGVLVVFVILETSLLRHFALRHSAGWWHVAQLAVLVAYFANVSRRFSTGFGAPNMAQLVVLCVSVAWASSVLCMCLVVNWPLCVRHYRAWQHRHGNFVLAAAPRRATTGHKRQQQRIVRVIPSELPV